MENLRVAIVHYWLLHMRGGEKVVEAMCELFPQADIYTHVYVPDQLSDTIRRHRIRTTFIQKLPWARKLYQKYLPLMPLALEELDLTEYDVVISSESGPAKGVITRPDALHVCYCHSPMRYLWDQYNIYKRGAGLITRIMMPWLCHKLRIWDVTTASRVDYFVANSNSIGRRIKKFYNRDAVVIHPPCDIEAFRNDDDLPRENYYLLAGQLVNYKRPDLAIEAFSRSGRRLVVIGEGEEYKRLAAMAGQNVEMLGRVSYAELKSHLGRCRALVFPGEEDFGIVPVEAMASGTPVIALGRGGALDTVKDGETGILFPEATVDSLNRAVERFESDELRFDASHLTNWAGSFGREEFKTRLLSFIQEKLITVR